MAGIKETLHNIFSDKTPQSQDNVENIYGKAVIDPAGNALIPTGTTVIAWRVFDGKQNLRSANVPGTVTQIRTRAFADCKNLEHLELSEGLKTIEGNVFTGCESLKTLTIPDSVTELNGWAFYGFTGIQMPVYNRSGTILYHYPCISKQTRFIVPKRVKRLHDGAFLNQTSLEEVVLPESLERIDWRAFQNCQIKKITIPVSVRKVSAGAFRDCKQMEEVTILCDLSALETGALSGCRNASFVTAQGEIPYPEYLRLQGIDFLELPRRLTIPDGDFGDNSQFKELANKSSHGDTDAMLEFARYFENLGDELFYECAANFWWYRAAEHGHPEALEWMARWQEAHPRQRIPSVIPSKYGVSARGYRFRSLGFLFFEPEREYSVSEPDADGVVEVSSWCGDDGPDEDGFGREEYYDWWYLDENLQPIPGVPMIHSYSHQDKRANAVKFTQLRDKAAAQIRKRKG